MTEEIIEPVLKVAAKAVIVDDEGRVLILREASTYEEGTNHGRYHVPGGRLNAGESYDQGLRREVKEETGLEIEPLYPIYVGEWSPVIKGVQHQIIAIFTVCRATSTNVVLSLEHDDFQWIKPADRGQFEVMGPEDKVIDRYRDWLQNRYLAI